MNVLILADTRFEEAALLAGLELFDVKITYFVDSNKTTMKTVDATLLVTDYEDQDFHLKNIESEKKLYAAKKRIEALENQLLMHTSEKGTQQVETIDDVVAGSPFKQQGLTQKVYGEK